MKKIVIAAVAAAAALVAPTLAPAADDPGGFVRNRVPVEQTLTDLVAGRFYEEVRCLERCTVTTQLGIRPADATRLGFANVSPGQYYLVGQVTKTIPAGVWTKIKLPLTADAKEKLAASETGVRIAGRLIARSTKSRRSGWASWIRTCALGG